MSEMRAYHPKLGSCIIRSIVPNTNPVRVKVLYVDLGLLDTCLLVELRDAETGKSITYSAPKPQSTASIPTAGKSAPPWCEARSAIVALRLGQCPEGYVDRLTVGSEEVREACLWALESSYAGRAAFVIFESPYGKGKTHALTLFAQMARARHRAVGSIVLDGIGVSLSQPMSLLTELAALINFPDGVTVETLPERLAELVSKGRSDDLRTNGANYLADCLNRIPPTLADNPEAWDLVVDYLSCQLPASQAQQQLRQFLTDGGPLTLQAIFANHLVDRPHRCVKMLREWAQACTRLGASRGLTLLFDEADVDYGNTGFGDRAVDQRVPTLRALGSLSSGTYLSAGFAITPGIDPYWEEDPVEELLGALGEDATRRVVLADIPRSELLVLASRIAELYAEAYETKSIWSAAETKTEATEIAVRLSKSKDGCIPRQFIRELLEKLDLACRRT